MDVTLDDAIKADVKTARSSSRLGALARLLLETPELYDSYTTLLGGVRLNANLERGAAILVTSAKHGEGKSTITALLAVSAALAGFSVLLVDGDIRRPWLCDAMGLTDAPGLGEALVGEIASEDAVHPVKRVGQLEKADISVMTAGRKSATVLLTLNWAQARAMLSPFWKRFDLVLIDSPPVLAVSDALLLSKLADGVLLAIGAGVADRGEVKRAKELLQGAGATIVGAALNSLDPKDQGRASQPHRPMS
jgi:capsular exopolysaccharide synthesis family protein